MYSNNLYSHDGEKHIIKGHSKADKLEQCVEPTEDMQKNHFGFYTINETKQLKRE
jgi:hypothetical protein